MSLVGAAARSLFERHLDLTPLAGRARGLTRCLFHEDRTPSLSVDLEAGVFHCFGCGAQGGRRRFAELVGEVAPKRDRRESPLQEARRRVARIAQAQEAKAAELAPLFQIADHIRRHARAAQRARALACELGPDHPRSWHALELAARVEVDGHRVEAELDEILSGHPA